MNCIFISYSHKDHRWLERLQVHLKPLIRDLNIVVWDDNQIKTGAKWKEEIKKAISDAKVAILLVSADFMASDFISSNELPPILENAKNKGTIIFPVILSASWFSQDKNLSQYQVANRISKPLNQLTKGQQEKTLHQISLEISSHFNHYRFMNQKAKENADVPKDEQQIGQPIKWNGVDRKKLENKLLSHLENPLDRDSSVSIPSATELIRDNINYDVVGTGVSGSGNFVGKDIHYTVRGNIFNINNPSNDSIDELKKILVVSSEPSSVTKDSDAKNATTLHDLRTIEKHIEEILNLLKKTDIKIGTTTKGVKAGKIQISRIDLLLKRAIVLIEQANKYWDAVSRNSDINMYRTKLKEAYRILQEASELDVYNTDVLLYMAKVQGKLTPSNPAKMRDTLYRIQNLLDIPHTDREKYHLAQATFLLATSERPVDDESIKDAREMFRELGRRDLVRQCDDLLQPAEADAESAKAFYKKGLILYSMGSYQEAIECFDKAVATDADDSKIWNSKGSILGNLGRYQEAIECFDKAIAIDANNSAILKNKGTALHYLCKYQEAIDCFDKAIAIDANDGDTWSGRGISLDYLGCYEQAIECFDKAIESDPKNDYAWYNKAVALDYLRKYEKAIVCYNKSIDINPDNAVAWYGKGLAINNLGNQKEGRESINKAKQLGLSI